MKLTVEEFRTRRANKLGTWFVEVTPFVGSPLDDGGRGSIEMFYADEAEARAVFVELCASGHVEHVALCEWRWNASGNGGFQRWTRDTWEAPPAEPVATIDGVTWWGSEAEGFDGLDGGSCTVALVRRAEEGEAEGGLGALARLMAGARSVELPPLSPAGWYWNAAVRGVWTGPRAAESAEAAMKAASAHVAKTAA